MANDDNASQEKLADSDSGVKEAPTSIGGIIKQLGPGLIVAGSIVGSGELIATTVTGAKAGFWLLWLIIIGCVIKVFVQVEMGRYSIVTGNTAMDGFVDVPGPRVKKRGNWLFWYWFIMFVVSIGQLGGIVGGVGQALSISFPITKYGKDFNALAEAKTKLIVDSKIKNITIRENLQKDTSNLHGEFTTETLIPLLELQKAKLEGLEDSVDLILTTLKDKKHQGLALVENYFLTVENQKLREALKTAKDSPEKQKSLTEKQNALVQDQRMLQGTFDANLAAPFLEIQTQQSKMSDPYDDEIWAGIITAVSIVMLVVGRFTLIQNFSTALVALFTLVTIVNLFLLQSNPDWGFSLNDVMQGLSFSLPPDSDQALSVALMAFGIIGVGANELVMYPYWCQEKGYGRFVGKNDGSDAWTRRAQGWMRVMRWDAWCSMVVYTFATVAFYLLGASILGRSELTPSGNDTIRYLAVMYEPVFGTTAQTVFLIGAFAVLYSTFFVANAAHARTFSDALRVIGLAKKESYKKLVIFFSAFFPTCCIVIYIVYPKPVELVLVSGLMQALMLPMLAGAAIYYRYKRIGKELQPGKAWDAFLWISAIGMLVAGLWLAWSKIAG